jgi:hypothetical protein
LATSSSERVVAYAFAQSSERRWFARFTRRTMMTVLSGSPRASSISCASARNWPLPTRFERLSSLPMALSVCSCRSPTSANFFRSSMKKK